VDENTQIKKGVYMKKFELIQDVIKTEDITIEHLALITKVFNLLNIPTGPMIEAVVKLNREIRKNGE